MTTSSRLPEQLLGVPEALEILHVSRATLYRLASQRVLPFYKIGGLKFDKQDLVKFIEERRVEAVTDTHERQEIQKFVVG